MEQRKQKDKKTVGFGSLLDIAVSILLVIVCMIFDVRVGIGAVLGVLVGNLLRPLLKDLFMDTMEQEQQEDRFLDTTILRENFSIPQNLPLPYAVLDIRGRVLMYNEPFAEVFAQPEAAQERSRR